MVVMRVTLNHLLPALQAEPAVRELFGLARSERPRAAVTDLPSAFRPAIMAALANDLDRPVLILTAINEFLPGDRQAILWAGPEALPYEQLPFDLQVSAERVSLLGSLRDPANDAPIVVASAHGLTHLVTPPEELEKYSISLRPAARLGIDTLIAFANRIGFQQVPLVQEPGQIARRGGIIDLWPSTAEFPARVDFFGHPPLQPVVTTV
jgi:transcription-repair coupling factor (superfamily II helicase)